MKEIMVWKDFQKNHICQLRMTKNNTYGPVAYFETWERSYSDQIKNVYNLYTVYRYTGFPYGENEKWYGSQEAIDNKIIENLQSIEDLYKTAEEYGFKKEHVDAFINQEEKHWVYDDEDNLIEYNDAFKWYKK